MLTGELAAACEQALARWSAPGAAIGVLVDGEPTTQGFGVLDLRTGAPVSAESTFRIASITKPFTATLALFVSQSGLISLDEELPAPAAGITPRDLLSHLGGFDGEAGDLARFGEGDDALPRLVAELGAQRQLVPPREIWSYCNAGFWLLGQVLADRAGSTFEQALEERVLGPLGLGRTRFAAPDATGHDLREPIDAGYPRARNASGGLVSTVGDLLTFARFHLETPETEALRRPTADTPGGAYGLGFALERVGELELWGHTGDYGGIRSLLVLEPGSGLAFAGLVNSERGGNALDEILDDVLEHAVGVRRAPPETVPLPAAELELLAGHYAHSELQLELRAEGDRLAVAAVELDRVTGARTPLPPLHARSLGSRLFALEGDGWERARFDFHPRVGEPRFVRFGSRLAERVGGAAPR